MLETIYVVIALLLFFTQLKNGLFTALITAVFWPIVFPLMTLFIFIQGIYEFSKDDK